MSWIPGWDSIDGTHFWGNVFFWGSIVALIFLGISEVISHRYSERKDELTAQQETETQNRHDEEMARIHRETALLTAEAEKSRAEIAAANAEAAKANERAAELKLALEKEIAARQPRHINPDQQAALVASLAKIYPKGSLTVSWKLFDEEAEGFGKQILGVLEKAGFDAKEVRGAFSFGATGQMIVLRDLKKFQSGPSWVGDLQAALSNSLGMTFEGGQMDATFKPEFGDVSILIGAKP